MTIEEMIAFLEEKIQNLHKTFEGIGNEQIEVYVNYLNEVDALTEIINNLKGQLPQ